MNHHPDLAISWDQVTVTISTHSEGGLTAADFELGGADRRALTEAAESPSGRSMLRRPEMADEDDRPRSTRPHRQMTPNPPEAKR